MREPCLVSLMLERICWRVVERLEEEVVSRGRYSSIPLLE